MTRRPTAEHPDDSGQLPRSVPRRAALAMDAATFRDVGHRLVDRIAESLEAIPRGPVTRDASPSAVRDALALDGPLPEAGADPAALLDEASRLLFGHSLFNAHPRFFGYITASPAPIGMLGDLLAAAVNPNVGAWTLSPGRHRDRSADGAWIAELIGYPADCGGLLVSGGNMANFVGFLAARAAKAGWDVRERGVAGEPARRSRVYASAETHTWIQKAADLLGLGTAAIRWMPHRRGLRMDVAALRRAARRGHARGRRAVPRGRHGGLGQHGRDRSAAAIAAVCRDHGAWFHVDGAYGGFAAALPDASRRSARPGPCRLGGRRSAQVALRAARGRLRAGPRRRGPPRRLRLSPAVLSLRRMRRRTTSTTARRTRAGFAP